MKIRERIERADEILGIIEELYPEVKDTLNKAMLVEHGRRLWEHTYKGSADDNEAEERFKAYVDSLAVTKPREALLLMGSLEIPDQIILTIGACRWFDQGLPVIRLGHKRAAAFMATGLSRDSLPHIIPPFRAFYIELPDDILRLTDENGEERKATGVLVQIMHLKEDIVRENGIVLKAGDRWRYAILTDSSLVQWQLNRSVEELAGLADNGNDWEGMGLPIQDYDLRVCNLVGRLICSTCLMMSNPANLKEKKEFVTKHVKGKRQTPKDPQYRVFMEGAPIGIDVRPAIAGYLRGERDTPRVRTLVRGHWRHQPHGPKSSLRKLIHIEPYWSKGLDGDPIMKRVYSVEGNENEPIR